MSQAAAAAVVASTGLRGGAAIQGQAVNDAGPTDTVDIAMVSPDEADGDIQLVAGSTNKTAGINPAGNQTGQSAGAAANGGADAANMATADAKPKDMPAIRDLATRANDAPAQTNTSATGSHSTTAATFGSELKLSLDASPTSQTAAARNLPNAAANQVAVQINRAVQDGQDKFVVNLRPGTLGKVSVQLEVGHDNRIIAVIAAERPDTLELLQRDSRALELALKDAGLKTDSGSLSFNLQGNGTDDSASDDPSGSSHHIAIPQGGDDLDTLPTRNTHTYATDASGVDIHV